MSRACCCRCRWLMHHLWQQLHRMIASFIYFTFVFVARRTSRPSAAPGLLQCQISIGGSSRTTDLGNTRRQGPLTVFAQQNTRPRFHPLPGIITATPCQACIAASIVRDPHLITMRAKSSLRKWGWQFLKLNGKVFEILEYSCLPACSVARLHAHGPAR
jgi:hypothetical protein